VRNEDFNPSKLSGAKREWLSDLEAALVDRAAQNLSRTFLADLGAEFVKHRLVEQRAGPDRSV
jgi:hypothetical protein